MPWLSVRKFFLICVFFALLLSTELSALEHNADTKEHTDSSLIISPPLLINRTRAFRDVSSRGTGLAADPFIIEGLRIFGEANVSCIEIQDTDDFFVVRNCHLSNSSEFGYGVRFKNVRNGRIESSTIESCPAGVMWSNCESVEVINCVIIDCGTGFSVGYSIVCNILDNLIIGRLPYGGWAIGVYECANMHIENNRIKGFPTAIWSNYGIANTVRNNSIIGNSFGFDLWACSNWRIYNNSIGWNEYNALCHYGSQNSWNETGMGNAWSDYEGGESYYINEENIDLFPKRLDSTAPVFGQEPIAEYVLDDVGNALEWDVSDSFPLSYSISNGTHTIKSGYWNGRNIRISVDGLPSGSYTYELTVVNLLGFSRSQNAYIIVRSPVSQPLFFIVFLIVSPVLLLVAVAIQRFQLLDVKPRTRGRIRSLLAGFGLVLFLVAASTFILQSGLWHWIGEITAITLLFFDTFVNSLSFYNLLRTRKQDSSIQVDEETRDIPEEWLI